MKKLLLTSALLLTGISTYAQGIVSFANGSTSLVTTNVNGVVGNVPAGPDFWVNLYYHVDQASAPATEAFTALGAPVQTFFLAGRFNGGNRTTPSTTAPGARAWFDVRVWESAFGATYEAAVGAPAMNRQGPVRQAIAGRSGPFNIQTGAGSALAITQPGGFTGATTTIVPEPSVIALGVLGLTGLLVLRRRRTN